jgi:hypothetical protein
VPTHFIVFFVLVQSCAILNASSSSMFTKAAIAPSNSHPEPRQSNDKGLVDLNSRTFKTLTHVRQVIRACGSGRQIHKVFKATFTA